MEPPKRPSVTPHNLDMFTEPVVHVYQALEEEIFTQIAKRLRTSKELGRADVLQWQAEKMQQLRLVNDATIKSLSKATGVAEKEIRKAIQEAVIGTIESTDKEIQGIYNDNGMNPPIIPQTPTASFLDEIMASYVNQTFRELDNFVNQTLITTNFGEGTVTNMYRRIVEETTGKVLGGTKTVNKAVSETVIKWADKGIETSFIDRGGHTWYLENYANTVIRSTVNRAYNEQRTSRMQDYGVDLVLVSALPDPREICSHIQGKVASLSNPSSHPDYPSVYEFGYGSPGGLRGINCRHLFYPFIEGLNTNNQPQYSQEDMTENRELRQKQRYYERQIKKSKRSLRLAEIMGDEDTINKQKRLVRARQAKIRQFVAENNLTRRYENERVIVS